MHFSLATQMMICGTDQFPIYAFSLPLKCRLTVMSNLREEGCSLKGIIPYLHPNTYTLSWPSYFVHACHYTLFYQFSCVFTQTWRPTPTTWIQSRCQGESKLVAHNSSISLSCSTRITFTVFCLPLNQTSVEYYLYFFIIILPTKKYFAQNMKKMVQIFEWFQTISCFSSTE